MTITLYPGAPAYPITYFDCVIGHSFAELTFTGRREGTDRLVKIVTTVGYIIEYALVN